MSFWTDFESALSSAVATAKTEIAAAIHYFTPLVEAGAAEIAQAALGAVLQQAPLVISGQEKLKAATASVVSTLAASGKSVAVNIAETAVQGAYNQVAALAAPKAT